MRRNEPEIVFGSVDAGVANPSRDDGLTFLDAVWDQAPFASHDQFVATVESVATEYELRYDRAQQTPAMAAGLT